MEDGKEARGSLAIFDVGPAEAFFKFRFLDVLDFQNAGERKEGCHHKRERYRSGENAYAGHEKKEACHHRVPRIGVRAVRDEGGRRIDRDRCPFRPEEAPAGPCPDPAADSQKRGGSGDGISPRREFWKAEKPVDIESAEQRRQDEAEKDPAADGCKKQAGLP